ncbi:MAG TPA: hypothetical protein VJ323_16685, partial [Bryobacteraceae bacterium]|nr:hypothetical protein [Bryobacteraceae bacterium]
MRWIARGMHEVPARLRVCLIMGLLALETVAVPFLPSPGLAAAGIALSYFFIAAGSTNLYTLPVDIYGAQRAAFAVSGLVASYGATTFVFNPLFGWTIERFHTYLPACALAGCLPLAGYFVIAGLKRSSV